MFVCTHTERRKVERSTNALVPWRVTVAKNSDIIRPGYGNGVLMSVRNTVSNKVLAAIVRRFPFNIPRVVTFHLP